MNGPSPTLQLACELIRRRSITPADDGCQALLIARLQAAGFRVERLRYGDVENFWAVRGERGPLFVFAGHTDVVPPGNTDDWSFDPFCPTLRDGRLYGRGAADMKGSLAAMIVATERFVTDHPDHDGRIGFLITGDEEGSATDGTVRVIEHLTAAGEHIDWCLVGEPSSSETVGDVIKNGRRGSLNATLAVLGTQGHVAYPELADNPVHRAAPALAELVGTHWDDGNAHFPPTSLQISNINAGTGATNVSPGELAVQFNFRFSTELDEDEIRRRVESLLDRHDLDYRLQWRLSGAPFLTTSGKLVDATGAAISAVTGRAPALSTAGGTSDGRFIAPTGAEVVELGPVNATIHKVDEEVAVADLDTLTDIYRELLRQLLTRVS